jgi:signal transduction histidine kinase
MNKWTLEFNDTHIEKEFNESYLAQELKVLQYSMLLGIFTYAIFLPLDYILYDSILFHKFIWFRTTISSIVVLFYGLSFKLIKNSKQYQFFSITIAIICFFANIRFAFFDGVDEFYLYTGNVILIIFIFSLLNIRFFYLIFISLFYLSGHLIVLYFSFAYTVEDFSHQAYGIVSVVMVSLIAVRIIESHKRQDFLNKKVIEEQKKTLENSIREKDELLLMLKERNEELDTFNYSVSHDLKTPLRNISSFSKLLEKKYKNQLDENGLEYLSFIVDGTSKMNTLIDDLLEYSKIRHTELKYEVLNMNLITERIFLELTQSLTNQPKLNVTHLPSIKGDKVLITQVWDNLISNAIKYSSKNSNAEITIGAMTTVAEMTYYIKDNGVGFDMKYANKLFELFSRLHSDSEYSGTGVGLSLVARIIKKHNGKIWAESKLGEGSIFYFTLPIK